MGPEDQKRLLVPGFEPSGHFIEPFSLQAFTAALHFVGSSRSVTRNPKVILVKEHKIQ